MSQDALHDKTHDLVVEVIDRIASDEEFRAALKVDPEAAMENAGYAAKVDALVDEIEADSEVSGFASIVPRLGGISRIDLRNTTIVASNTSPPTPTCAVGNIGNIGRFGR